MSDKPTDTAEDGGGAAAAAAAPAGGAAASPAPQRAATAPAKAPKAAKRRRSSSSDDNMSSNRDCMICLSAYATNGPHRLVCLGCGHLFGKSCIDRWIKERHKCPTCFAKAKLSDVRVVFARDVRTEDTSRADQWKARAEAEAKRRAAADRCAAKLKDQLAVAHRQLAAAVAAAGRAASAAAAPAPAPAPAPPPGAAAAAAKHHRLEHRLRVTKGRVVAFGAGDSAVLSSSRLPCGGYGYAALSLADTRHSTLTASLHASEVRDVAVHGAAGSALVLTTALDKALVVTDARTRNAVQRYVLPAGGWSCTWCETGAAVALAAAGMAGGAVAVYDPRNPAAPLLTLASTCPQPLHSLAAGGGGALVAGAMCGVWRFPLDAASSAPAHVALGGHQCASVCAAAPGAAAEAPLFYASTRGAAAGAAAHVRFGAAADPEDVGPALAERLCGHAAARVLSRTCAFRRGPAVGVFGGDEGTRSAWLWDARAPGAVVHKFAAHAAPVLATAAAAGRGAGGRTLLASVSESELLLHSTDFAADGAEDDDADEGDGEDGAPAGTIRAHFPASTNNS